MSWAQVTYTFDDSPQMILSIEVAWTISEKGLLWNAFDQLEPYEFPHLISLHCSHFYGVPIQCLSQPQEFHFRSPHGQDDAEVSRLIALRDEYQQYNYTEKPYPKYDTMLQFHIVCRMRNRDPVILMRMTVPRDATQQQFMDRVQSQLTHEDLRALTGIQCTQIGVCVPVDRLEFMLANMDGFDFEVPDMHFVIRVTWS